VQENTITMLGAFRRVAATAPRQTNAFRQPMRNFALIQASEMRPGTFWVEEKDGEMTYFECTGYKAQGQGRQGRTHCIDYVNLETGQKGLTRDGGNRAFEAVDFFRQSVEAVFVDEENNVLVCQDEDFDQIEVPLALAKGMERYLEPGTKIMLMKDKVAERVFKLGLPRDIMDKIKKA
jgi:translation elongation factor P/translation initiation factor 5A